MRVRFIATALTGLTAAALFLPAAHATDNPSFGKWYPHARSGPGVAGGVLPSCDWPVTQKEVNFADRKSSKLDDDGCGSIWPSFLPPILAPIFPPESLVSSSQTYDWPAKEPLKATIPAGTPISGVIWASSDNPGAVTANITVNALAGGNATPVATGTTLPASSAGGAFVSASYFAMKFSLKTTKALPAGSKIDFVADVNSPVDSYIGYGAGHQSVFKVG